MAALLPKPAFGSVIHSAAANDPKRTFAPAASLGQLLLLLAKLRAFIPLGLFKKMPKPLSKVLLLLLDVFGISRLTRHVIAFTYWPKDQRAVFWASDIKLVMVTKEPKDWRDFYSIRVFEVNGGKNNYTVRPSVLRDLEDDYVTVEQSPKLESQ